MKFETIWDHNLSDHEKLGVLQRSILSAVHALASDGASLGVIQEMKTIVDEISSTVWSLFVLSALPDPDDQKFDDMLAASNKQLDRLITETRNIASQLNDARKNRSLKKETMQ